MNIDYNHLETHGYQVVRNVIESTLIDKVRGYLESEVRATLTPALEEIGCAAGGDVSAHVAAAIEDEVRFASLTKPTRDALSGHFSLAARMSEDIRSILKHQNFLEVVRGALNSSKIFAHMPPTARFVLPHNSYAGVPPHQDISYNKHLTNFLIAWVPLVDIDEFCGGVTVFHGSGSTPELLPNDSSRGFWFGGVDVKGYAPLHCSLKAGDILLLNKHIIHASMPNKSERTRFSIDFRFFGENDSSSKHFLDIQSMTVVAP